MRDAPRPHLEKRKKRQRSLAFLDIYVSTSQLFLFLFHSGQDTFTDNGLGIYLGWEYQIQALFEYSEGVDLVNLVKYPARKMVQPNWPDFLSVSRMCWHFVRDSLGFDLADHRSEILFCTLLTFHVAMMNRGSVLSHSSLNYKVPGTWRPLEPFPTSNI